MLGRAQREEIHLLGGRERHTGRDWRVGGVMEVWGGRGGELVEIQKCV